MAAVYNNNTVKCEQQLNDVGFEITIFSIIFFPKKMKEIKVESISQSCYFQNSKCRHTL